VGAPLAELAKASSCKKAEAVSGEGTGPAPVGCTWQNEDAREGAPLCTLDRLTTLVVMPVGKCRLLILLSSGAASLGLALIAEEIAAMTADCEYEMVTAVAADVLVVR